MSRIYKITVNCDACGNPTPKRNGHTRWCKACVPDYTSFRRMQRYGLSKAQFDQLIREQQGRCALCPAILHSEHINGTHVDHDHGSGKVRGLLCGECNHGIGHIERLLESNELEKVISYIKRAQ